MVDAKYQWVKNVKPHYRNLSVNKCLSSDKHATLELAMASMPPSEDRYIWETWPSGKKIPVYGDNVK